MAWKDDPYVPMDAEGNVYRVYPRYRTGIVVDMVRVEPMTKALKLSHFIQTSSSISVVMKDFNGVSYPMFFSEFEKLVLNYPLDKGATPVLTWGYDKRGSAYGLTVPEEGN